MTQPGVGCWIEQNDAGAALVCFSNLDTERDIAYGPSSLEDAREWARKHGLGEGLEVRSVGVEEGERRVWLVTNAPPGTTIEACESREMAEDRASALNAADPRRQAPGSGGVPCAWSVVEKQVQSQ